MEEFKIEKGVPVPPRNGGRGAPEKYPFSSMEVGDSFLAPEKAQSSTQSAGKRLGMKFTSRKEADGVRIWRVE